MLLAHDDSLFTISQAAKACGVSRSTLMRLEDKELLMPSFQQPDNGYRYYTVYDLFQIRQLQQFDAIGLSASEIRNYYASDDDPSGLLSILEPRLCLLKQITEELQIRARGKQQTVFEQITLPSLLCCVMDGCGCGAQDRYDKIAVLSHKMAEKGWPYQYMHTGFSICRRSDYLEGRWAEQPAAFTACIPVLPEKAPPDAVMIPGGAALSMLHYGSSESEKDLLFQLAAYLRKHRLQPDGFVRAFDLMHTSIQQPFRTDARCMRYVIPILPDT